MSRPGRDGFGRRPAFRAPAVLRALAACWLAAAIAAAGSDTTVSKLRILHDGSTSFSKRGASFSGIGETEFQREDFVLRVKGQFRMQGAARVVAAKSARGKGRFQAKPDWVSLVALGEVELEIPGAVPQRFRAAKAVYLFAEDRWLLDGEDLRPAGSEGG